MKIRSTVFCNAAKRHSLLGKKLVKILCSRGLMEHPENVPNCSLYQVPPTLQISWKSVQPFFRNVANRQRDRQSNGQRWKHNFSHGGDINRIQSNNIIIRSNLSWFYIWHLEKHWQKVNQILESQQTPHISPSLEIYGVCHIEIWPHGNLPRGSLFYI